MDKICFGILFLLCASVSGHSIYDECESSATCPGISTCRCNGERGYMCLCPEGHIVDNTNNGYECVKASLLGEQCTETKPCANRNSLCHPATNICVCAGTGMVSLSENGQYCVTNNKRAIGDVCATTSDCGDFILECYNKACACRLGFRTKTEAEFWAEPQSFFDCVPANFKLDDPSFCPTTTASPTTTAAVTTADTATTEPVTTTTLSDVTTTNVVHTTTVESIGTTTAESVDTTTAESVDVTTTTESVDTTTAEAVEATTTAGSVDTTTAEIVDITTTAEAVEATTTAGSVDATTTAETMTTANTIAVFAPCTTGSVCPANSACKVRGCSEEVCTCNIGFIASSDKTACVQAKLIGDNCTGNSECVAFLSYCSARRMCTCISFVRETLRRTCALRGVSEVGEACTSPTSCQDSNAVCSLHGRCECRFGYRQKTLEEFWNDPFARMECVHDDFSLESCALTTTTTPAPVPRDTLISQACTVSEQCPVNAVCSARTCGQAVCRCGAGFVASWNKMSCTTASRIGETCSSHADCVSPFSRCQSDVCTCSLWFHRGVHGCVSSSRISLNQFCFMGLSCADKNALCNRRRTCQCTTGFHERTTTEFWLDPRDTKECVKDMSAEDCNSDSGDSPSDSGLSRGVGNSVAGTKFVPTGM